jgi:hypothetical protein
LVVSVDFMVAARADVAGFTAGAVRDGHTLAAGQKLLVSDSAGPDFKVVYTVQASGAPTVSSVLSEKICLVTVGKSRAATPAGLYVYTPQIGALRQVVSGEAGAVSALVAQQLATQNAAINSQLVAQNDAVAQQLAALSALVYAGL